MLKKSGWLGIMTSFFSSDISFKSWHYIRDPTHVVFYTINTFEYIAQQYNWKCEINSQNVVLMQKTNDE